MAEMTEAEYELALARIAELMGAERDTPEAEELNQLADVVVAYEQKHFPWTQDNK